MKEIPFLFSPFENQKKKHFDWVFFWVSAFKFDNLFHHIAPFISHWKKREKTTGGRFVAAGLSSHSATLTKAGKLLLLLVRIYL